MKITYSLHAQEQMRERNIHPIWAEETVKFPDVTKKFGYKYHAIKKLNGVTLEVVYVIERYIKITYIHLGLWTKANLRSGVVFKIQNCGDVHYTIKY